MYSVFLYHLSGRGAMDQHVLSPFSLSQTYEFSVVQRNSLVRGVEKLCTGQDTIFFAKETPEPAAWATIHATSGMPKLLV